ncbi:anthranilate phosphoribosyltransferase [Bifidobacterium psychraerophilum]|jgi:anthranilate phosphoribosyltransferase|uniref:Anthranilate phosphoribosyltransferase n=1 Tax=Bifidobacterium psychraerophilum TaxID=218140 RepID=A0A087CDT0_9BIFI|nr:anthranilate phosphoribosyltransferase [Bifidobacterium psychraerophilum]KFI81430.1 anthranilate phosphoribosyltransferase 1 [Bifidobacterium psychraerophilum]MCI1659805.1 anthranilate phosphoribosyltransferase [Bifidobacterium psychraerophilum]MCI1805485.1 anthranilate phosphoribosyltransferase [Bifidobacterium psychraerophilum]MCI2176622.1 anthranilate phosphoribosyltransferase [Bifidobacterium psychraerophilum]MCI2181567.1 anthranilate phosphoribosyltransferase [Bifidobacterium psychraer
MVEPFTWKAILTTLVTGTRLSAEQSYWFVDELMSGNADPVAVGATLAAMQTLGLDSEEVAGAAKAMVSHAKALPVSGETTDIVGTGGDGASTVNLSTMGAIVAAAAGVKIVKHGNRAASSKSGTADCLESLGLPLDLDPEAVAEVGDEVGITFAFAKTFHPSMRFVGPVRSALGIPTVFNVLGPLTNPAHPSHVAIGCADRRLSPMMADVFARRGQSGLVYTSSEGLDEMAPTGPVSLWEVSDGKVSTSEFDPTKELGLERITVADLRGGEPEFNAQVMRDFVAGKDVPSRTTALLNAASAIVADAHLLSDASASLTERFTEAYALAGQAIADGAAQELLQRWIATAQSKVQA